MKYDIWDLKQQFERATTLHQIEQHLSRFIKKKGFDLFFYHHTHTLKSEFVTLDNFPIRHFPANYLDIYVEEGHIEHDPVYATFLKTHRPVLWSHIDKLPLNKKARYAVNMRLDAGLVTGATIPIIEGHEKNAFTVAADQSKDFNRLFKLHYGDLFTALVLLKDFIKEQNRNKVVITDLTSLQQNTLQSFVEYNGDVQKVAERMIITKEAVNDRLREARKKFGVENTFAATLEALRLGIIYL